MFCHTRCLWAILGVVMSVHYVTCDSGVTVIDSGSGSDRECKPISLDDIAGAAECSMAVYEEFVVEKTPWYTSNVLNTLKEGEPLLPDSEWNVVAVYPKADKRKKKRKMKKKTEKKKKTKKTEKTEKTKRTKRTKRTKQADKRLDIGARYTAIIVQKEDGEGKNTTMFCFMGTVGATQLVSQSFDAGFSNTDTTCLDDNLEEEECPTPEADTVIRMLEYDWTTYTKEYENFIKTSFFPLVEAGSKYIITGHSLGGALASVLSLKSSKEKPEIWDNPESALITFGQPRVGNKLFNNLLYENVPLSRQMRVTHHKDEIIDFPDKGKGFLEHGSREVYISNENKDNKVGDKVVDELIVCRKGDTNECNGSWKSTNYGDHKVEVGYYDPIDVLNKRMTPAEKKQFEDEQCETDETKLGRLNVLIGYRKKNPPSWWG